MRNVPATLALHFGVIDVPYTGVAKRIRTARGKKKATKPPGGGAARTTGDVAEILEKKYGIMSAFLQAKEDEIDEALADSVARAINTLMKGGTVTNPIAEAENDIGQLFRDFLINGEIERAGISGVPTQAALRGVSHRKAHPYAKGNARRPSFVDTGMYVQHFVAWAE